MKRCTKCEQEFPATREYFRSQKKEYDVLVARCKSCEKEDKKRYAGKAPCNDPNVLKQCTGCGAKYPATTAFFYPLKMGHLGLTPRCKYCLRAYNEQRLVEPQNKPDVFRTCLRCKQNFPATQQWFTRDKRRPDGLGSHCKTCHNQICQRYRENNPERVRKISRSSASRRRRENPVIFRESRQRYNDKHRDKVRARKRRYYEKHRDRERQKMRDYYASDKERARIKKQEWYYADPEKPRSISRNWYQLNKYHAKKSSDQWRQKNPQRVFLITQRRRARKLNLPNTLTLNEWKKTLAHWDIHCSYCGQKPDKITLDHYVPLSHPACPGTIASNCVPACKSCNSSKGDAEAFYWMRWKFGEAQAIKIQAQILAYFDSLISEM